uniref:ATP-binding protein n=1 Tax=uncultured Helicobacter sp. TaxID=175537 RepID=A0A650EL21_9HELI|nr:ATP-binding protein [uncultured Helicobacter sp.]
MYQDNNLLECFIQECLTIKDQKLFSDNPLYALIAKARYALAQSLGEENDTLEKLSQSINEPMKIAIIGQFSSGKSTFLNALLGEEILPSGITPVTAKVCQISYGEEKALEIHYKNGRSIFKHISFLNEVSDLENAKISHYQLFLPLELLKTISFLDTPGFNSQNQSDTDTTNAVLEEVDGIIWLTLIDNVGKNSEKMILQEHIKRYASKSLCVLNQKDRLKHQSEIDTSLDYAKKAFAGLFEDVIAISAKNALKAKQAESPLSQTLQEDSNIQAVMDFLHTHIYPLAQEAKTYRICTQLRFLLLSHARKIQRSYFSLKNLCAILRAHNDEIYHLGEQSVFFQHFPTLFTTLESHLDSLTQHIYNALERREETFEREDKKFGIKSKNTYTKAVTFLPKDRVISELNNTDSPLYKEFIKLGFEITQTGEEFEDFIHSQTSQLQNKLTLWLQDYHRIDTPNAPLLQSLIQDDLNPARLVQMGFLSQILNDYEALNAHHCAKLDAQLALLRNLITLQYTNATTICALQIHTDIQEALNKHRKSPDTLPLFNPTLENIRDGLNLGFHFSFLQERLSLTSPLHKKSLWEFSQEMKTLCEEKCQMINQWRDSKKHKCRILNDCAKEIKMFWKDSSKTKKSAH